MTANHPRLSGKWMPVPLGLLMLAVTFIGAGLLTFAAENKQAEPNQPKQKQKAAKQKDKKPPRPDHSHPAFTQRTKERNRLVKRWIKGHGVRDPNVLTAMRTVPRHEFVRPADSRRAYADQPIPIGLGQTISQPYIVAYMTESLKLRPDHKVLEVGTGSGYQAAVCAELAQEVYTIEIIEDLATSAKQRLKELGYANVSVKAADGYFGWPEHAPFDAVIVTCAAGFVPPPLIEQLKPNGRMIIPLGSPFGSQTLVLVTKDDEGNVRSKSVMPVRFVPMTGRMLEPEPTPKK
jgi:protein-L-isoaspartate(D-aspartate) O-methyltransferase